MPNFVPGVGCLEPKLMIIGEAPGRLESERGEPFQGATGQMLDSFLLSAGISRSEVYLTNVVKYQPPFNDLSKLSLIGVNITQSIDELWVEIARVKPNAILALGDLALEATTGNTGIMNWRGSILRAKDGKTKVIPTIHPSALFSRFQSAEENATGGLSYVWTKFIQHDIIRAVEESSSSELNLPYRELTVAKNSLDLFRYLRQYDSNIRGTIDIESINCVPVCVGIALDTHAAISVPILKRINNITLIETSDSDLNEIWRLIDKLLQRMHVVGHNFKYDDFKLSLLGFQIPNVISDTLLKFRVLFPESPEKRLSTAASLWTREPFWKDEGKEFKLGKSPINQLFLYNAKDCAVNLEVDAAMDKDLDDLSAQYNIPLKDYFYKYMMRKHKFYLNMENVGFAVDHEFKRHLSEEYKRLELEAHTSLVELVGHEVNVKSSPQIFNLLYKEMGFKAYRNNPTSEDNIIKLLQTHCKDKDGALKAKILEGILSERRVRDQRSRYINFTPDFDGRCKSSFNISATETCRSSTSVPKKPVRPTRMGLAFHTISKHGKLAKDIRRMFIPDKGKVFIQADSSQAEARVVAVLARDFELLKAFDTIDIHRRTAGLILGMTPNLILEDGFIPGVDELEKDGSERFCGKKVRHAGNYNMKKRRFQQEFNTDSQKFEIGLTISEWKAGDMLEKFHSASPNIKNVFHYEIEQCISETRTLIDPFGGIRIFNGRIDEDLFKEGYANIPQRTVAHLVQTAGLNVYDEIKGEDAQFVSENHDALVLQVPEKEWELYARLLKREMERPIDFSRYCSLKRDFVLIIPSDVEIGEKNYAEMKKVKL